MIKDKMIRKKFKRIAKKIKKENPMQVNSSIRTTMMLKGTHYKI